jgi:ribosomal protein S18 acetylase RimI-like enzyme
MVSSLQLSLRPLTSANQEFLWEMLYQALYVPPGVPPFPREILQQPEISRYAADWGQLGDLGWVAVDEATGQPVAAVWFRLLVGDTRGYGYFDEQTPELSLAVLPAYRGQGLGTRLLNRLLVAAQLQVPALSLSVSADNPAVRLYRRLGFEIVQRHGDSLTMLKRFSTHA